MLLAKHGIKTGEVLSIPGKGGGFWTRSLPGAERVRKGRKKGSLAPFPSLSNAYLSRLL